MLPVAGPLSKHHFFEIDIQELNKLSPVEYPYRFIFLTSQANEKENEVSESLTPSLGNMQKQIIFSKE